MYILLELVKKSVPSLLLCMGLMLWATQGKGQEKDLDLNCERVRKKR